MKIVADDAIPFLKGVFEPYAEVVYLPGRQITSSDLRSADALITRTRTKCTASLLSGTAVRFVATATIGMDHIDEPALKKLGIAYSNAPGCNAPSVAQYFTSLIIRDAEKNHTVPAGKTVGIIGVGHVGSKVEAAALALGMKVLRNDPPRARAEGPAGFVPLDTILRESDFITIHTPLNQEPPDRTFHLADEAFFLKMARKPFFLNASRGEVTAQDALKGALITGKVRAAALDVWEDEPDINQELLNMLAYATPHIAGYSADGKANGTTACVRAIAEFFGIEELKHFTAQGVPEPANPLLTPDPAHAVRDAVLASYDILRDDAALRADPESFETLRAKYPVRREFFAYRIANPEAIPAPALKILTTLGFQTKK